MRQVFTLCWYLYYGMYTFVSRHQCLLGLANLKMEVGSSFEASVPVYRSALRRVPGDGNSRSSVTTGPALDS